MTPPLRTPAPEAVRCAPSLPTLSPSSLQPRCSRWRSPPAAMPPAPPNWRFAPPRLDANHASMLQALNVGGETHTFTRVAAFGGGIVPPLNALSHNPIEAPECKALEGDDFVAPGGTYNAPIGAHDKTV